MSQVHNVMHVPVHSLPLAAFAVAAAFQNIRVGVAGRNEVVTKLTSRDQEENAESLSLTLSGFPIVCCFAASLRRAEAILRLWLRRGCL
jgi:hypothetical protein